MTNDTTSRTSGYAPHISPYAPFLNLSDGYPDLSRDIRRNLRRGSANLTAGRVRGRISVCDPDGLRHEITAAYVTRCLAASRPLDLTAWRQAYDTAYEVAVLRIDGRLAAWVLARYTRVRYIVLAGNMAHWSGKYRAGRLLEAWLLARVLTSRWQCLDWGSGLHPEALIAVS